MKRKATALALYLCALVLSAPFALAQTPDGQTPAEETVCDPLKADGITKGLYGLCVAFCEAQDHATLSNPITEEQLDALAAAAPSGRILANYNKKKSDSDPDMPCIKVEEPCPCWTEDEFLTASQEAFDHPFNFNVCDDNFSGSGTLHLIWDGGDSDDLVFAHENFGSAVCQLWLDRNSGGINRALNVTPEELGACRDRIIARQNEFGLVPNEVFGEGSSGYCWDPP